MLYEVYLGIGSNLGDRPNNIAAALKRLYDVSTELEASSLYQTRPQGFSGQPPFVNAACRIWTRLGPFDLLAELKEIEAAAGSRRSFVNGPRTLDIDILVYGRRVLNLPGLTIPHPRMATREFVLAPLAEIAPGLLHPVLGETIRTLLLRLRPSGAGGARPISLPPVAYQGRQK
jgi:2-amino-4-hydroxy-6-hydroxymethyldihydropteridine diphosphokinase